MAVDKLKKIEIIGYKNLYGEVIDTLQKLGTVQVINFQEHAPAPEGLVEIGEADTKDVDITLQQISYIINLGKKFEEKQGLVDSLTERPQSLDYAKLADLAHSFDLSTYYQQCQDLETQGNALRSEEMKIKTDLEFWQPWTPLTIDIKELVDTKQCSIFTGIINSDLREALLREVEEDCPESDITLVSEQRNKSYFIFVVTHEARDRLLDILKRFEYQEVRLSGWEGRPEEILASLEERLHNLQRDSENLTQKGRNLFKEKGHCLALYDYYYNLHHKQKVNSCIAHTQKVFSLIGWLRAKDERKVLDRLRQKFNELDVTVKEPDADDVPPIKLINPQVVSPFESVTDLYGLPNYRELDPTPLLAPFFFLFFGVCMTDACYGLILALACFFALRHFYLKGGTRRVVQLFFICGISTFFCGAFTGSWLGDFINYLPASFGQLRYLKDSLIILDPISDPLKFLIFALALGFIQVWFGIFVQMYKDMKAGDFSNALLSRLPWLILLPGVIMLMMVKGNMLQGAVWASLAKWSSLLSAGTLLLFEGRAHKNIFGRVGTGLLALYGIIGYYADMLSYSRLLALGLATGVIANVVNQMAFLTAKVPYVGIVMAAVILLVGHIFNIVINLLGAFVHTSRLQFIEFFTKFFEGGGKPFIPFAMQTRYINLKEE
jgi:V/A-type H+-transporting ATPase subunit I